MKTKYLSPLQGGNVRYFAHKVLFESFVEKMAWTDTDRAVDAAFEKKNQADIIERILRHCGLWTETKERSPSEKPETVPFEPIYVPIDEFLANF